MLTANAQAYIDVKKLSGSDVINFRVTINGDDLTGAISSNSDALQVSWEIAGKIIETYTPLTQKILDLADMANIPFGTIQGVAKLVISLPAPLEMTQAATSCANPTNLVIPARIIDACKIVNAYGFYLKIQLYASDFKEYDHLGSDAYLQFDVSGPLESLIMPDKYHITTSAWPGNYPRTNEYDDEKAQSLAKCTPGSEHTVCPSQDSCVTCSGKCYDPGSHSFTNGVFVCSQGRWSMAQNVEPSGYPRSNEYWDTATASAAGCAPGSATNDNCPTPDSCVSCSRTCYPPGTYHFSNGDVICTGGKWIQDASSKPSGYPRSNEYWDTATAGTASCAPGSVSTRCDTQDSCVTCGGKCYRPGSYPFSNGKFICSGGKWKQDVSSSTPSGYPRTNEYWDTSIASCTPGSVHATCPSPNSCVGCNGQCSAEGRYWSSSAGMYVICSQGKWKPDTGGSSSGYPRTNEYWDTSVAQNCAPGSAHAVCSSPTSCVDCYGQCYLEGQYGSLVCDRGKWNRASGSGGSPNPEEPCPECPGWFNSTSGRCECP